MLCYRQRILRGYYPLHLQMGLIWYRQAGLDFYLIECTPPTLLSSVRVCQLHRQGRGRAHLITIEAGLSWRPQMLAWRGAIPFRLLPTSPRSAAGSGLASRGGLSSAPLQVSSNSCLCCLIFAHLWLVFLVKEGGLPIYLRPFWPFTQTQISVWVLVRISIALYYISLLSGIGVGKKPF